MANIIVNPFNPNSGVYTGPSNPGSSPPTPNVQSGSAGGGVSAGPPLVYPPEMATGGIRLAFSFYTYQKVSVFQPTTFQLTGSFVFLPVPDGIVDQYNIEYPQYNPGFLAQLIPDVQAILNDPAGRSTPGYRGMTPHIPGGGSSTNRALDAVAKKYEKFWTDENKRYAIGRKLLDLGGISEDGNYISDNIYGTAPNPNTTLALKAPQLRQHSFSWTLAPKSIDDSNRILAIINQFKTNLLPDVNASKFFLTYPSICLPEFIGQNAGNYLYTFKPCMITGFSANPSPNGPAFFNGTHAPAVIQITIQLMEVMFFLKGDATLSIQALAQQDLGGAESTIDTASTADDVNVLGLPVGTNANE